MKYKDLDLAAEWREYTATTYHYDYGTFRDLLRAKITNPQVVEERVRWCDECSAPVDVDAGHRLGIGDRVVCDSCWEANHPPCAHCGERSHPMNRVVDGVMACPACIERHYFHCRNCGIYVRIEDVTDHLHDADGCCESPALEFTFPCTATEGGTVAADERFHLSLSEGQVTDGSITRVVRHLVDVARGYGQMYDDGSRGARMYDLACRLDRDRLLVGRSMTTREGNFGTRLKRYAYRNLKLKIDPPVLSEIGNLVTIDRGGHEFDLELTRNVNLPASMFAHDASCWWSEYKASRCILKSNGGLGLRAFNDNGSVVGRCWIMPMVAADVPDEPNLDLTFDTHSGLYFAFNGYGTLTEHYPRVVAALVGAETYSHLDFEVERYYVNNSAGYLVGPAAVVNRFTGFHKEVDIHSDLYAEEMLSHV